MERIAQHAGCGGEVRVCHLQYVDYRAFVEPCGAIGYDAAAGSWGGEVKDSTGLYCEGCDQFVGESEVEAGEDIPSPREPKLF